MNAHANPQRRARTTPPQPAADASGIAMAVALSVAAAIVTASLVFVVHTKSRQTALGYRVHDLRQELVSLGQQRASLEVERAALSRPTRLVHVARTELNLVPPRMDTSVAVVASSSVSR
jgi:cell division protein FtsL